jgi:hypothetical protein
MKKLLLFLLLSTLVGFNPDVFAGKWRINNNGVVADFISLQEAVNSVYVLDGDTLLLESSLISYGAASIYKRVVVLGTGYFLLENDSTQAIIGEATVGDISFYGGSEGSILMGFTTTGVYAMVDNLLIKRMRITSMVYVTGDNIVLTQSYVSVVQITNEAQNFQMTNNVVDNTSTGYCFTMGSTSSATITNNIFGTIHFAYNSVYRNNIATGTPAAGTSYFEGYYSVVTNNIGADNQYGSSNGNQSNIDMTTVFEGFTTSTDAQWRLKPGSPAIGAGLNGVDCGVFGGPDPYVLSGMPSIPAIWFMNINGTEVSVKAKSH